MSEHPAPSSENPRDPDQHPSANGESDARVGIGQRIARWGDRMLLRSVPEFLLFPSDAARVNAVKELDQTLEDSRWFWRGVIAIVIAGTILANASLFIVPIVTRWRVPVLGIGLGSVAAGLVVLISISAIIWLWRMGVVRRLRDKLIESGVPVCRECGYLLRGLNAQGGDGRESLRCPECGWKADDAVLALCRRG